MNDLNPVPLVYFTDLFSLQSRSAPADEPLPKALAKSCNFPFAFSGFKNSHTEVDGGLALNLPVDHLKSQSNNGEVIAISFESDLNPDEHKFLWFVKALFSAAIQSGVDRSINIIGAQNIFKIKTKIDTFDFQEALTSGLNSEYDLIKIRFSQWLDDWLEPIRKRRPSFSSRYTRPVISTSELPVPIVRQIDAGLKHPPIIEVIRAFASDVAVIDEHGDFTGRYISKYINVFRVLRPISVLQFDFQTGPRGSMFAEQLLCAASIEDTTVPFTPIVYEMTPAGSTLRSFRLYFLFDPPLEPTDADRSVVVDYQFEADDGYPNLGTDLEGAIVAPLLGDAQELTLSVAFPKQKIRKSPTVTDAAHLSRDQLRSIGVRDTVEIVASEAIPMAQVQGRLQLERRLEHYEIVCRRAWNIRQGQGVGFGIS